MDGKLSINDFCESHEKMTVKELRELFDVFGMRYKKSDKKQDLIDKFNNICQRIPTNSCVELSCLLDSEIKVPYKKLLRTNNLVNAVISGYEVTTNNDTEESGMIKKRRLAIDKDMEQYQDPGQPFKDIMTDLTTTHFLKSEQNVANFIELIFKLMDNSIDYYKKKSNIRPNDIIFIYKGGNALKSIYLKYLYETAGVSADEMYSVFHRYFKKSDADFQIYINPNLSATKWDKVYNDMIDLSYLVVNRVRMIFQLYISEYFDYYGYNDDVQKKLLDEYLNKLNKTDIPEDINFKKNPKLKDYEFFYGIDFVGLRYRNDMVTLNNFDPYKILASEIAKSPIKLVDDYKKYKYNFNKSDILVVDDPENPNTRTLIYKINPLYEQNNSPTIDKYLKFDKDLQKQIDDISKGNEMYISVNRSICFGTSEFVTKFALIRMKANFTAFFKTPENKNGLINIPGELIDISISHKDATEMDNFYNNLDKYVDKYKYVGRFGIENQFNFKAYTPIYYIKDLHKMLYQEHKYPWENEKYEKRLYRLFFLYLIDLIKKTSPQSATVILKDFAKPFKLKNPTKKEFQIALLDTTVSNMPDLQMHYFLQKLLHFIGYDSSPLDYSDFNIKSKEVKEFFNKVNGILSDSIKVTNKLNKFVTDQGKINPKKLRTQHKL
jgi:ribosomal protein S18